MKSNHGLRRLVSVCLLVCLCFSMLGQSTFEVHAEEKDFKKVTFSLDSNVVEKSSIDLYLYEDVYYIAIDDLCSLTRCSQSKENEIISIRQGFWSTKFDIGNQTFDDEYQKVDTTILEIEENKYAVPAVMFLNYFKATAYTKGDKLYCKMPEFTAWEALDVNYEDTLIDIYELYGGEGNVAFSLTLDIIMDFITGDMANSEKYLSDAFVEALEVTVNDRDSVKEYKESIIQNLYSELHSDEIDDFLESLQDRLSISAEPVEWYIESHYNSLEKSFVRLAYDAHEAGNYDEVKNYGKKFYDAFAEKNRVSKGAEKFFNNMDYLMVFISAAAETANEMKYTDATNNLVYNVMGQENLQYLGISADDDLWFTVADKYQSVLGTGIKQLESKLTNFFTDKLFWENATGAIVSNSAGISLGSWTLSLNASRFIAKNINPITRSIIEGFEADRRGLYLSELQQKVYWVLSNTVKKFEGQLDNKDVYAKYIEAEQLYCRTSIAMYENLIKMVKQFGKDPDYWTDYFQERIDMLAISLYQLTSIQDDGVINCLPLDLSTFQYIDGNNDKDSSENIFETIAGKQFVFSSGAGAWGTTINISKDGIFSGEFVDSNISDTGEGYAKGTVYTCKFNGKFTSPQKINEYTYSMQLEYLNTEEAVGKEYYKNDKRFVFTEPVGLENSKEWLIYSPGTPLNSLTDYFKIFLSSFSNCYNQEKLLCYGLYNVNEKSTFIEYNN